MEPNLFDYATKELSMDAFFCWLFAWLENKYKGQPLNKIANNIINNITGETIDIKNIEIKQQYKDIDFYLRINNSIIIIFEDKTDTTIHDNQLKKYKNIISKGFPNDKKYYIYNKSNFVYNQERKIVEDSGFTVFDINKIIELLKGDTDINNIIYKNYVAYLMEKRDKYGQNESFLSQKITLWKTDEWRGFINRLSNTLKYSELDGHFNGSWWFILERTYDFPVKDVEILLRICNKQFQINFSFFDDFLDKNDIVNKYRTELFKIFKDEKVSTEGKRIVKHTVMLFFTDFLKTNDENILDLEKTIKYIENIRKRLLKWIDDTKQKTCV
jgi:DNA-binding transcriptional MerR regulator